MYYLVNVDYNLMAPHLTRRDCEGFRKSCLLNVVDGTDMLWKAVKRMGMLGVSVRRMEALTVKMESVTVIGKGS